MEDDPIVLSQINFFVIKTAVQGSLDQSYSGRVGGGGGGGWVKIKIKKKKEEK